eukprot:c28670_g1_i1 orf=708-1586(-)
MLRSSTFCNCPRPRKIFAAAAWIAVTTFHHGVIEEQTAHSFCLEDRALLCRNCDVSIHSSNHLSSNHKRFLLTGTRASLHVLPPNPIEVPPAHKRTLRPGYSVTPVCSPRQVMTQRSSSTLGTHSTFQQLSGKAMASPNIKPASSVPNVPPPSVHITSVLPVLNSKISPGIETASKVAVTTKDLDALGQNGDVGPFKKSSISDRFTQTIPAWQVNDLLYLPDNGAGDSFGEMGSSKVPQFSNRTFSATLMFYLAKFPLACPESILHMSVLYWILLPKMLVSFHLSFSAINSL